MCSFSGFQSPIKLDSLVRYSNMNADENLCPLEGIRENSKPNASRAVTSALHLDKPAYRFLSDHRYLSLTRVAAGAAGSSIFIQSAHRPLRYGLSRRFATMPSAPSAQACRKMVSPSPSRCSESRMPGRALRNRPVRVARRISQGFGAAVIGYYAVATAGTVGRSGRLVGPPAKI